MPEYRNYQPSSQDVRRAIEEHGRAISLTKLLGALTPIAHQNHFKFVDYPWMKEIVREMVKKGELVKAREPKGFYRYELPSGV